MPAGGGRVSARWTVRFPHSDPRVAARRAAAVLGAMRVQEGWRQLEVEALDAAVIPPYISADKNGKQAKTEYYGRRLLRICREAYPGKTFQLLRDEGVVALGTRRVVRVVAQPDSSTLEFAMAQLTAVGMEKDRLQAAWQAEMAGDRGQQETWSL